MVSCAQRVQPVELLFTQGCGIDGVMDMVSLTTALRAASSLGECAHGREARPVAESHEEGESLADALFAIRATWYGISVFRSSRSGD